MIAPIEKGESERSLARAVQHSVDVLTHVATLPDGAEFDVQELVRAHPHTGWIRGNRTLARRLNALLRLTRADRERLARAVAHDVAFDEQAARAHAFAFQFCGLEPEVRAAAAPFLQAFYDILRRGFPRVFDPDGPALSATSFEAAWRAANTTRVCPACLDQLKLPVRGRSRVDRDHFFPRTYYPMLAVHPGNLTLMCTDCNSRIKHDSDPLLPGVATRGLSSTSSAEARAAVGALESTALPYVHALHDKMTVEFSAAAEGPAVVRLAGLAGPERWAQRVRGFDQLFALSERWSHTRDHAHECIVSQWLCDLDPLDEDNVARTLRSKISVLRTRVFEMPSVFLQVRYAEWLLKHRLAWITRESVRYRNELDRLADDGASW